MKKLLCFLATGLFLATSANAINYLETDRADVQTFINNASKELALNASDIETILAQAEIREDILELISRPAEKTKPWHEYREIFLTEQRIQAGAKFWHEHRHALQHVEKQTGVPASIIVAIIGVETFYGKITGKHRVIDALSTLAFAYPPRSEFFTGELKSFFQLVNTEPLDPLTLKGSYAGAIGGPQFMPSSYLHYAVDGNDDGSIRLDQDWEDVFASVANYFNAHDWEKGGAIMVRAYPSPEHEQVNQIRKLNDTVADWDQRGWRAKTELSPELKAVALRYELVDGQEHWLGLNNFYTITRYNRSRLYARAVTELTQALYEAYHETY